MSLTILWTEEATITFDRIVEYIHENWANGQQKNSFNSPMRFLSQSALIPTSSKQAGRKILGKDSLQNKPLSSTR